jgi:hypothetical protein
MRRYLACLSIAAVAAAGPLGCSEEATGSNAGQDASAGVDGSADSLAGDGISGDAASGDSGGDASINPQDTSPDDTALADTAGEDAADVDWSDLLDPEDTAAPDTAVGDTSDPVGPVGQLYAETPDELYRLDLTTKAFTKVGKFTFNKNPGEVTDIALDQGGALYAITNDDLFTCAVETAKCTWLAPLPEIFNGMTFVPKGTVSPTADTLIGISQDGDWTQITITGNKVSISLSYLLLHLLLFRRHHSQCPLQFQKTDWWQSQVLMALWAKGISQNRPFLFATKYPLWGNFLSLSLCGTTSKLRD